MSLLLPFKATDLFSFNAVNLDNWTETYSLSFYLSYLSTWPDLCYVQHSPSETMMGYVIGKAEGRDPGDTEDRERHGHVTAITVAPEYRRLGLAKGMMELLEKASEDVYQAFFVDLFVRPSNAVAVSMYEGLGYDVYRTVLQYYAGGGQGGTDENGYDMRKAMRRDRRRETVRDGKSGRRINVSPHEIWFEPVTRPRA